MKRIKMLVLLLSVCCIKSTSIVAQSAWQNRHVTMRNTTEKVLKALTEGDTAALVNMFDTGYNHLGKPGARQYFSEDVMLKCRQYKKMVTAFAMPSIDNLQLSIDKNTHNTICILPMTGLPKSVLNVSRCAVVVSFYPAKLFSMQAPGQCLGFYIDITPIRKTVPVATEQ